jgi:hypothetical protein
MSGSIFSANTIAGLPVIEAFSNNKVTLGPYSSPIIVDASGNISGSSTSTGSFGSVHTAGYVGIGTTSPGTKLQVGTGDNEDYIRVAETRAQFGYDGSAVYIGSAGGKDLTFMTVTGTERMRILTSNGNVGINDTTPTYKLDVNGTGRFTGDLTLDSNLAYGSFVVGMDSGVYTINLEEEDFNTKIIGFGAETELLMGEDNIQITGNVHVEKDGDFTTPLVRFVHGEAALEGTDTILDLDFDDDQSIGASNYYILFQNQDGVVGSVNSEVAFSTFTGAHVPQRPSGSDFSNWKPGMIVKSTGDIIPFSGSMSGSLSMAWPIVDIVTTQKDKAVMGVYDVLISAPIDHENYTTSSRDVGRMAGLNDNAPSIHYNAIGEGKLLVTDTNGNIETGDYICSSARIGHGEKQDDDLLHNYTVAKATEPYNFTSASNDAELGYKSILIACTYHCG